MSKSEKVVTDYLTGQLIDNPKIIHAAFKSGDFSELQRLIDRQSPTPALNLPLKEGKKLKNLILLHPEQCASWVALSNTDGEKERRESIVQHHFGIIHSLIKNYIVSKIIQTAFRSKNFSNLQCLIDRESPTLALKLPLKQGRKLRDTVLSHPDQCTNWIALSKTDGQKELRESVVQKHFGLIHSLIAEALAVELVEANNSDTDSKFKYLHEIDKFNDNHDKYTTTMDSENKIPAGIGLIPLKVSSTGTGTGEINCNPMADNYSYATIVTLTANANTNSKFKCWHGDARGVSNIYTITMDAAKEVSAEFEAIENFSLTVVSKGTGTGKIVQTPFADRYIDGAKVTLTAKADTGSKFKGWGGDAIGVKNTCEINMHSRKLVSAEFVALKAFVLTVATKGNGTGEILRNFTANKYFDGTNVNLIARADVGSKFKCWHGDVSNKNSTYCSVLMNSEKTVIAEFVALESFPLNVTAFGTGNGNISRSIDSPSYFDGAKVTLNALAEEDSIFNGWHGDVETMDNAITLTMNSAISISAEFEKLTISDTEITAELVSTTRSEARKDQLATVFRLMLRNTCDQKLRIKVPLTSYVSQSGQTNEQSGWATGLVNGSKGVTLSPGTFSEMGLIYFLLPAKGDRLYINIEQTQPSARICFTFQCIAAGSLNKFLLINANQEIRNKLPSSRATDLAMANALKRIESLECTLIEVLRRLDAIQSDFPRATSNDESNQMAPAQTLSEVLAWVAEHDRITVSEFRARLLPLDLLPSAVINELNERSLDLTGDLALEDHGDEIIVVNKIYIKSSNE